MTNSKNSEEKINVQEINEYLDDFLQTSQPTYDPTTTETIAKESSGFRHTSPYQTPSTNSNNSNSINSSKYNNLTNSFREFFNDPLIFIQKFEKKSVSISTNKTNNTLEHDSYNKENLVNTLNDENLNKIDSRKQQHIRNREMIKDLGQGYMDRKKEIYDASLINCAEIHSELTNCFRNGSLKEKLTWCNDARTKFWNSYNKTDEENEEILNKADIRFQQELTSNFEK
ncbi:10463_t:CDS:2 [Diversispora eburnea]|uniref:10463_t:CDS:1 n=1 Tax=Diversispora eburnea TaxID=1213867 RepID=A0A9N9G911_9GLOM|nr:10463_t:CDS:2 [Diversispora eburnea]